MNKFRDYQEEADQAITKELEISNKCIVKMFCGTGKSLLMRKCKVVQNKTLVVYVFPSLSLIEQFYTDYLFDFPSWSILKISSEQESTTDSKLIQHFLGKPEQKIICITYQSFKTLLDNLFDIKIDVCIFDEAHHAVGETYQILIFENNENTIKQIFMTATPKNANGIVMYDRERPDVGMCGRLVYDYSYLRGVDQGYLNPFEICVSLYTENTNKSVYESIARAILESGNSRVLTFHANVNTDSDTSVNNFVDSMNDVQNFKKTFEEIRKTEFPDKSYKTVKHVGLSSSISMKERKQILDKFDKTKNNEVFVLSSCETIGEGIDTKNANMCVFVDPKTSYVKIIQNIGRIVRKVDGIKKPNSTILIPCWVDKAKYVGCNEDKEKCDEAIRQDMGEGGNFNCILNVLSALKQEDEDIYDICLNYPDSYSPLEIERNLERQGYYVDEQIGDGDLMETLEYLLDDDIDYEEYEECETEEEMIQQIANDKETCIEIFTDSLETPIERYDYEKDDGSNEGRETIRMIRKIEDDQVIYEPVIKKGGNVKRNVDTVERPSLNRFKFRVHTNSDISVLWNIKGDISKDIGTCIIDCEVVKYDPMEVAQDIVERCFERERKGLNLLPKQIQKKNRITKELQEYRDAIKLGHWKKALKGKGTNKCSNEVKMYLDTNLKGWNDEIDFDKKALENAQDIVKRCIERERKGLHLFPKQIQKKNRTTEKLEQEDIDATKLGDWKTALKGKGKGKCSNEVKLYLDTNLKGWNDETDLKALENARDIVKRCIERERKGLHLFPKQIQKKNRTTEESKQEDTDAIKLRHWKNALKGKGNWKCSDQVKLYLDTNLKGWRDELDKKALKYAQDIVERCIERERKGLHLLPKHIQKKNRTTEELEQENRDATKLRHWKTALKGKGKGKGKPKCSNEVKLYLDTHLPKWNETNDTQSSQQKPKPIKSMKKKTPTSSLKEESPEKKRERVKIDISTLHQKYKTMKSENLNQYFKENPQEWHKYHSLSQENETTFPEHEIPRNRIIQELERIKTNRKKQTVDLGCGKAQISQHFSKDPRFEFINYDHLSTNDNIISCDISKTPLDDNSVEICILSLAMWGSNNAEYLQEAYRILETNGQLFIIEPTKRWSIKDEQHNIVEGQESCRLIQRLEENNFKIMEKSIEKFSLFRCIKL